MKTNTIAIALLCTTLVLGAALPASAGSLSSTASVANAVPTITDVDLPGTVSPEAGATVSVDATVTVADNNGWQDLVEVRVTVEDPQGAVHVLETPATADGTGSGVSETFSYSFDLQYYDEPGTYTVLAVAEDSAGAVSSSFQETFVYEELAALSIAQSSLNFGAVDPGVRSSASELTVENQGNVAIDLVTSGTPLVHEGGEVQIDVSQVRYDLDSAAFENETSLTSSPVQNVYGLAPGASSTGGTWWALEVPSGEDQYIPAGEYEGTVTVSAAKS